MARKRTGTPHFRHGRWYAQVFVRKGLRPTLHMATITGEGEAKKAAARAAQLAELAACLAHVDEARALLDRAAGASDKAVKDLIDAGRTGRLVPQASREGMTFGELSKKWTTGELARSYPDHVRKKKSVKDDVQRLDAYILPHLKDLPVAAITLDHAEQVMCSLPSTLGPATRRQVAQLMSKALNLAVFPLRLRDTSPLPRGWLPKPPPAKAKSYLYPAEDRALLGNTELPLAHRVLWGILAREGLRKSEALALEWSDVDLQNGSVNLDENKSDDPRSWALGPDVAKALAAWHVICGEPPRDARVLELGDANVETLRGHLRRSGVDRPQLFEASKTRQPIRIHDLRGTFVTLALACGRTETWVTDRTGHKSSDMVHRYKRTARHAGELGLGWLAPMHEAVPELAEVQQKCSSTPGAGPRSTKKLSKNTLAEVAELVDAADSKCVPRGRRRAKRGSLANPRTRHPEPPESAALNRGSAALREESVAPIAPYTCPVEEALATALERASAAGEWGVVQTLAAELEARRKARLSVGNVVQIDKARRST